MDAPIGWSENVCPERRLVVLGRTGSGKSATCNNILDRDEFKSDICGQSVTDKCQRATCQRFGRNVQIIDTPGLFDTGMSNADITREVVKCIGMTAPGPHAFVMVVRVDRFTKEEQDTVEHFKNVFGEGMMKYLMILFTRKDDLDNCGKTIEKYLEDVPQMLRDLLKSCGNRYIAFNNNNRASPEERNETVQRFLDMVDRIHSNNSGEVYTSDMYKEAEKVMLKREERLRQENEAEVNKLKTKIEEEYQTKMTAMEEAQTEKIAQLVQQLSIKEQQKEQQLEMEKLKMEIEKQRLHMESDLQKERQRLELEAERRKMFCEANPPNYRETARKEVSNEGEMVMDLIKGVVKLVGPELLAVGFDKMREYYTSKPSVAPLRNESDKAESPVDEPQVTDKTSKKDEAK
ncbi:GTPase IMAP family member 9-like [Haliotis rubra]|uniref:GTPase IMAP family member 9-like n=1 Tax=Haliotis rubra TaxID=36100 RepID=UPI001EE53524|nr:GTPase IMAP family member 9-like [Haliotis rubra]